MSEVPLQIIVAAFQDEGAADSALATLKEARREKLISIDNAAVIRKDDKGKLHIKETEDMGGGKGAGIGVLVGGAIGLIGGPVGVALGGALGAAVGGITAKLYDGGFKDDRLREIGKSLTPGTSAIVAVIEHRWVADLESELAEVGADVMTAALADVMAAESVSIKTAPFNPVHKGGVEWRSVFMGVAGACPRGFCIAKWVVAPISL